MFLSMDFKDNNFFGVSPSEETFFLAIISAGYGHGTFLLMFELQPG